MYPNVAANSLPAVTATQKTERSCKKGGGAVLIIPLLATTLLDIGLEGLNVNFLQPQSAFLQSPFT